MHLNLEKCAFGVRRGKFLKFLRFLLTNRGIKANLEKCRAILEMRSPSTLKEVQQLTGCIAALSRFLARSFEKAHPFFYLLKKQVDFKWMKECERAFQDLKKFLVEPLVLSKSKDGEPFYIYKLVIEKTISSVLVKE